MIPIDVILTLLYHGCYIAAYFLLVYNIADVCVKILFYVLDFILIDLLPKVLPDPNFWVIMLTDNLKWCV